MQLLMNSFGRFLGTSKFTATKTDGTRIGPRTVCTTLYFGGIGSVIHSSQVTGRMFRVQSAECGMNQTQTRSRPRTQFQASGLPNRFQEPAWMNRRHHRQVVFLEPYFILHSAKKLLSLRTDLEHRNRRAQGASC